MRLILLTNPMVVQTSPHFTRSYQNCSETNKAVNNILGKHDQTAQQFEIQYTSLYFPEARLACCKPFLAVSFSFPFLSFLQTFPFLQSIFHCPLKSVILACNDDLSHPLFLLIILSLLLASVFVWSRCCSVFLIIP